MRKVSVECALVLLLAAILVWPLFRAGYLDYWGSAAGGPIAAARFLAEHPGDARWQPLWYGGTRPSLLWPPLFIHTVAAGIRSGIEPVRAYNILCALLYCLGIAGVYLLVRTAGNGRVAAWLAAAGVALLSPSFLVLPEIRADALHVGPQRLNALVRRGDAPHLAALAVMGFALAAAWRALTTGSRAMTALAAVLLAAALSFSASGAVAVLAFYAILAWSVAVTHPGERCARRALLIAVLALGLCAFWLTPSFAATTIENRLWNQARGARWGPWLMLAAANVFVLLSARMARGRKDRAWPVFAAGAAALSSLYVLGGCYLNVVLLPDWPVYVPEFDLAVTLLAVEAARFMWRRGAGRKAAVMLVMLAALIGGRHYIRHPWRLYRPSPDYHQRIEYRLGSWFDSNLRGSRVVVSGSVQTWLNAWSDAAQFGGRSTSGWVNPAADGALWRIFADQKLPLPLLWMQAFGVDAIAVHEDRSEEVFHEAANPGRFAALPVLFDSGSGDRVYRVPRPAGLAHVVDASAARRLRVPRGSGDQGPVEDYVRLIERGRPAGMRWESPGSIRVKAALREGEALLVQVNYDPCWRTSAPIQSDVLGQLLIAPPPGEQDLLLTRATPAEDIFGYVLAGVVLIGLMLRAVLRGR